MGESERAGSAQAVPAIIESVAGVVSGEILVDPTTKTPALESPGDPPTPDKVAKERGMRPLTRP